MKNLEYKSKLLNTNEILMKYYDIQIINYYVEMIKYRNKKKNIQYKLTDIEHK